MPSDDSCDEEEVNINLAAFCKDQPSTTRRN